MKISKRGGGPEKKLGWVKLTGGFQNERGNPTFEIELRDRKGQNRDFQRQIGIHFLKYLPAAAKDSSSLDIYHAY